MPVDSRLALVEACHLLAARNFTTATGGNLSIRRADGSFWVTPSRLHKARVEVEDLVRVAESGETLEGLRTPSSETFMHLMAYQALPSAGAIIHAHPPASTGFAQAGKTIDTRSSSEAYAILGPEVPVIPYAPPSSPELAELVGRLMQPNRKAYLMAHHGVLTWGEDLWEAYDILDTLELSCQTLLAAYTLGGPQPLPDNELRYLAQQYHGDE